MKPTLSTVPTMSQNPNPSTVPLDPNATATITAQDPKLSATPPDPNDSSSVLYNPFLPDAPIPPPWYCSQTNEPGRPRARSEIAGGLIIPRAEGWTWYKRMTGTDLDRDHSEDLSVVVYFKEIIQGLGFLNDIEPAPRWGMV